MVAHHRPAALARGAHQDLQALGRHTAVARQLLRVGVDAGLHLGIGQRRQQRQARRAHAQRLARAHLDHQDLHRVRSHMACNAVRGGAFAHDGKGCVTTGAAYSLQHRRQAHGQVGLARGLGQGGQARARHVAKAPALRHIAALHERGEQPVHRGPLQRGGAAQVHHARTIAAMGQHGVQHLQAAAQRAAAGVFDRLVWGVCTHTFVRQPDV